MGSKKRAAMEMSVGTIVTIVLLMSVLVLGLVLTKSIFRSSQNAVEQIDSAVQNEINKLFADENKELVIYPSSRAITLKKGKDPAGFAFSVKNKDVQEKTYSYKLEAQDVSNCRGAISKEEAESYALGGQGEFTLKGGATLEIPRLIKFVIPETAPPCTIVYYLKIEGIQSGGTEVFVTIK